MFKLMLIIFTIFASTSVYAFEDLMLNCKHRETINHKHFTVSRNQFTGKIEKTDMTIDVFTDDIKYKDDRKDLGFSITSEGCAFIMPYKIGRRYLHVTITNDFITCESLIEESNIIDDDRITEDFRLQHELAINRNTGVASYSFVRKNFGKQTYQGGFYPMNFFHSAHRIYHCEVAKKKF